MCNISAHLDNKVRRRSEKWSFCMGTQIFNLLRFQWKFVSDHFFGVLSTKMKSNSQKTSAFDDLSKKILSLFDNSNFLICLFKGLSNAIFFGNLISYSWPASQKIVRNKFSSESEEVENLSSYTKLFCHFLHKIYIYLRKTSWYEFGVCSKVV